MCYADGRCIATSSDDNFVRFFNVASGQEIGKAIKHESLIETVCFSPDGTKFSTGSSDKVARIFDAATQQEISRTAEHQASVVLAFSPDSNSIVTGCGDLYVRIFDVRSGKEIKKSDELGSGDRGVFSVCFLPNGKSIAVGSGDKIARIVDAVSGKEIKKTVEHGGPVSSVSISADGNIMFTSSHDARCYVFNLSDGSDDEKRHDLEFCMVFAADCIAVSSQNLVALTSESILRVNSYPHNFTSDSWLPAPSSIVLEWMFLPLDLQKRCFLCDSQIVLGEFFSTDGGELVSLASKWLDPNIGHTVLSTLERLFNGYEPVVNAGLILRELLGTHSSNVLPHAPTIRALLNNVARHISHAARDEILTQQLFRAACAPSIRHIISEFWINKVQLVPSDPIVARNVEYVTFSETIRMYVASSPSLNEPVFERHFNKYPPAKGNQLDFENFIVPFANTSHMSTLLALVQIGDIDIFGTTSVRAIVQHKWQMYGLKRWVHELMFYIAGLALLVALCLLTWQHWSPGYDHGDSAPPAPIIVSALFCALCIRSAYREATKFIYSVPTGEDLLLRRIWSSVYFTDFWHLLHLVHIVLGISVSLLACVQSPDALPVLAITAFLRWWGILYYLQARMRDLAPRRFVVLRLAPA